MTFVLVLLVFAVLALAYLLFETRTHLIALQRFQRETRDHLLTTTKANNQIAQVLLERMSRVEKKTRSLP